MYGTCDWLYGVVRPLQLQATKSFRFSLILVSELFDFTCLYK